MGGLLAPNKGKMIMVNGFAFLLIFTASILTLITPFFFRQIPYIYRHIIPTNTFTLVLIGMILLFMCLVPLISLYMFKNITDEFIRNNDALVSRLVQGEEDLRVDNIKRNYGANTDTEKGSILEQSSFDVVVDKPKDKDKQHVPEILSREAAIVAGTDGLPPFGGMSPYTTFKSGPCAEPMPVGDISLISRRSPEELISSRDPMDSKEEDGDTIVIREEDVLYIVTDSATEDDELSLSY
uniref:Uncharacterized protein n=1 Tax=Lepeophtheirus salmonis TaxID=72036 RepID=A0A0K2V0N1_LEPSM